MFEQMEQPIKEWRQQEQSHAFRQPDWVGVQPCGAVYRPHHRPVGRPVVFDEERVAANGERRQPPGERASREEKKRQRDGGTERRRERKMEGGEDAFSPCLLVSLSPSLPVS